MLSIFSLAVCDRYCRKFGGDTQSSNEPWTVLNRICPRWGQTSLCPMPAKAFDKQGQLMSKQRGAFETLHATAQRLQEPKSSTTKEASLSSSLSAAMRRCHVAGPKKVFSPEDPAHTMRRIAPARNCRFLCPYLPQLLQAALEGRGCTQTAADWKHLFRISLPPVVAQLQDVGNDF